MVNNPLRYTDPNGEFLHLIIGATIGGTVSGINSVRHGGNFFIGKGYSKISELRVWGNDNSLGGTAEQNVSNLKSIQEDLGWKPGKLGVNDMDIDGNVNIYGDKNYYYRQPDGIINAAPYSAGTAEYSVSGFVNHRSTGLFKMAADMYLSFHKSSTGLKITVNHELIHAYHAMIGLKSGGYSEFSATSNTIMYLPGYSSNIIQLAPYSSAFSKGYVWPNYLLPIW